MLKTVEEHLPDQIRLRYINELVRLEPLDIINVRIKH